MSQENQFCGVIWLGPDTPLLEKAWSHLELCHVQTADMALRAVQHGVAACLLIDQALPGLNAEQLVKTIRQRWPHVGLLLLGELSTEDPLDVDCALPRHVEVGALADRLCQLVEQTATHPGDSDYERLEERARRLERLALGTVTLSETIEVEGILASLREVGRMTVDADDVAVLILSEEGDSLSDVLNLGVPGTYLDVCQATLRSLSPDKRQEYLGDEVLLRERLPDMSTQLLRVREAAAAGAGSYMRVPVNTSSGVMGFVAMFSQRPRQFNGAHLQLGRLFAAQVASVVRNTRLYQRLSRAEQRQNAVNEIAQLITEDLALDTVLQRIVQESTRIVQARHGLVLLCQPDGNLIISAVHNLTDILVGHQVSSGVGQVGKIVESAHPIIVEDYQGWTFANPDLKASFPDASVLVGVPLIYRGEVLGVLQVIRGNDMSGDLQDVQDVLMMFAPQAAVAIAKAQLHETVRQEEQRLRTILTRIPAAVVVCDAEGHVQMANPEAERLLKLVGLSLAGIVGRHVRDIVKDVSPDLQNDLRDIKNALEMSLGKAGEYLVHIAPITTSQQTIGGYVAVAQDVTELRHGDRMKANLHRILTHDLGNLIMLARSPLDMLNETDLTTEQRNSLKSMMSGSLERMEALIRDVMDLEMADSLGHATMTPYHLTSLAQQAVRRNQERAKSRSITLEYQEISKPPQSLKGHAVLIMQTIDNLVSNAVKYTPNGGRVDVISSVEGDYAVIRVKDTGYGIPADRLEDIFEPFVRIRDPRTQQTPGTGLGLSLVKAFVEAHGGTVTVTSELDKGSEFTVHLPMTLQAAMPMNTNAIQRIHLSAVVESKGLP